MPAGGPGAALSSWRENSCASDPGEGEKHSKQRKPWDIAGQCRWPQRQTTLTSLDGISSVMLPPWLLTLTPVRASPHLLFGFERSE